ncbi:MAG: hypothetical protein H7296_06540 [Bacteroidia bacterium]|nr:hypothetical protein [Bacteroidia bacterium]
MKNFIFLLCCSLSAIQLLAQADSILTIPLYQYAKDDRFDKYQITLALFITQQDTILSMDFEGSKPLKNILIKKPPRYKDYAYGNLFFTGSVNEYNPGYISVLVCNPYSKNPQLIIDKNQNFDFNDDPKYTLPYFDEPAVEIELANKNYPDGKIKIALTRNKLFGQKFEFKKQMDEYYSMAYKGRKFVGLEYTYREQRYITRSGFVKLNEESFKIALYDANSNGLYNDPELDKVIFVNSNDSVFDATNPLNFVVFSKKDKNNYFEKNGRLYQIMEADATGQFIKIKASNDDVEFGRIKEGKKVPKIKLTLARGEKFKLTKYKKKQVYLYFGSNTSKNFQSDTLILRQIAEIDTNRLKVICVLYVNKSYELRMFGSEAHPNYLLAFGGKELSKKLGINSVPQSLWLGKRRRVKKYGLKPNEFLRAFMAEEAKK